MNDVRPDPIELSGLTEYHDPFSSDNIFKILPPLFVEPILRSFRLGDDCLQLLGFKDAFDVFRGGRFRFNRECEGRVYLLIEEPVLRRLDLGLNDVCPCRREAIYRSKDDIQRKDEKKNVVVPAVVDIEDSKTAVDRSLGRC